jgi:hypothetical protein
LKLKFRLCLTVSLVAVVVACSGGGSSTPGPSPLGEGTVDDPTAPFTLAAGTDSVAAGASVTFPPGALPAGAKVRLATGPKVVVPAMVAAGPVIQVNVEDAAGSPIRQLPDGVMATVTVPFRTGLAAAGLKAFTAADDGSMISQLPATPSATDSAMDVVTNHFSLFLLLGPAPGDAGTVDKPVSKIALSAKLLDLEYDQVQEVDATVLAADGTVLTGKTILWTVDDKEVATLNGENVAEGDAVQVQAVGRGTTAINVTVQGEQGVNSVVLVSVAHAPISELQITAPKPVKVGVPAQFTVKALDSRGHDISAGKLFFWKSTDETLATVTEDGLVTGLRPASAQVTVTSEDVVGANAFKVEWPDVSFLYGEVGGSPATCMPGYQHLGSYTTLYTVQIPKPASALTLAERDKLYADLNAKMKAEHPDLSGKMETYYGTGIMSRNHVVFALADVFDGVCTTKLLFIDEGWTFEEARAAVMKQVTGRANAVMGTFAVIKELTGP